MIFAIFYLPLLFLFLQHVHFSVTNFNSSTHCFLSSFVLCSFKHTPFKLSTTIFKTYNWSCFTITWSSSTVKLALSVISFKTWNLIGTVRFLLCNCTFSSTSRNSISDQCSRLLSSLWVILSRFPREILLLFHNICRLHDIVDVFLI